MNKTEDLLKSFEGLTIIPLSEYINLKRIEQHSQNMFDTLKAHLSVLLAEYQNSNTWPDFSKIDINTINFEKKPVRFFIDIKTNKGKFTYE